MRMIPRRGRARGAPAPAQRSYSPGVLELTAEQRAAVPDRYEVLAEALLDGTPVVSDICWLIGRDLVDDGVSLAESLEGLRRTTRVVLNRDPSFDETQAVSVAWGEATLAYLHQLSCADPMTGLATLAHVRERISELYRDARDGSRHALVVTDAHLPGGSPGSGPDSIAAARRMSLLGQTARSVFDTAAAIGQVSRARLVVVVRRDDSLATRVSLLKRMVEHSADRVWIEGLPDTDMSAGFLLDELARGA